MNQWKRTFRELMTLAFVFSCISLAVIRMPLTGDGLYGSDFVLYFRPLKEFIFDHFLRHGTIPMWNPYQFSGTPLISNIQASLFYPLGFLFYLMPSEQAYLYTLVMHSILGCLFMYIFMRDILISPLAELFFSDCFYLQRLFHGAPVCRSCDLYSELHLDSTSYSFSCTGSWARNMAYALAAGLILGIQILGGFPQIAFYTILGAWRFSVSSMAVPQISRQGGRVGMPIGADDGALLFGFSLSAVQVLPTQEFASLSTGGGSVMRWPPTNPFTPRSFLLFSSPIFSAIPWTDLLAKPGFLAFLGELRLCGILSLWLAFVRTGSSLSGGCGLFFFS